MPNLSKLQDVSRFLDLEAVVDREEEEEDEYGDEDMEDFLDNSVVDEEDVLRGERNRFWKDLENDDDGVETYMEGLAQRMLLQRREEHSEAHPHAANFEAYPIYRVRCIVGMEEEAVFYLLQDTDSEKLIRSAFTRGSIRGHIYVESLMSEKVVALLRRTPGIIRRSTGGVITQAIDQEEWPRLMTMTASKVEFASQGQWVQIRNGDYRGDVGLVSLCASWGSEVLLVPRLQNSSLPLKKTSKRKRTRDQPPLSLFDPSVYQCQSNLQAMRTGQGTYRAGCITFQHGLIVKRYDHHSLKSGVLSIPSEHFYLFLQSKHPFIALHPLPRPAEWSISPNDSVTTSDHSRKGVVRSIGPYLVDVELDGEEHELVAIEWKNIRKIFSIADFVEICSGASTGTSGWIQTINDDIAVIISKTSVLDLGEGPCPTSVANVNETHISEHEVHVNWLKNASPTYLHVAPLVATTSKAKSDDVFHRNNDGISPLVGTEIIVSKKGHPWKGYRGVVKNVVGHNNGPALRLQPANTLAITSTASSSATISTTTSSSLHDVTDTRNAWDPNSRTPVSRSRSASPVPMLLENPTPPAPSPSHPLLDTRLLSIPLWVLVNGGGFNNKDVVVSVTRVGQRLCICRDAFKTTTLLEPSWVSISHPNPTRDNGLLVVIRGEHCGKYVRRIHHRYGDTRSSVFVQLAVLARKAGESDVITDERLELSPEYLCLAYESPQDKKLNQTLMHTLREQARQILQQYPPQNSPVSCDQMSTETRSPANVIQQLIEPASESGQNQLPARLGDLDRDQYDEYMSPASEVIHRGGRRQDNSEKSIVLYRGGYRGLTDSNAAIGPGDSVSHVGVRLPDHEQDFRSAHDSYYDKFKRFRGPGPSESQYSNGDSSSRRSAVVYRGGGHRAPDMRTTSTPDYDAASRNVPLQNLNLQALIPIHQPDQTHSDMSVDIAQNLEDLASPAATNPDTRSQLRFYSTSYSSKKASSNHGCPKRRTAEAKERASDVRHHLNELLHSAPFDEQSMVSIQEAMTFQRAWDAKGRGTQLNCCDADNFRVMLHCKPRCGWNMSAARIFAKDFIEKYGRDPSEAQKVQEAFLVRISVLQRQYRETLQPPAKKLARMDEDRRVKRKKGLFDRRRFVVAHHPALKCYEDDIDAIGWKAMSSDESDHERSTGLSLPGLPQARLTGNYFVVKPQWRSTTMSQVFHGLDTLYPVIKTSVGYNQRGQLPHLRIHDPDRIGSRNQFPTYLPLLVYDSNWITETDDKANYEVFPNRTAKVRVNEMLDAVLQLLRVRGARAPTN
ncbi:hypothetical protein CVT24_002508 [Panaeolus cyanescens]|uniref:NGN domain-containing protein n=1 Tax=Panaeolus cyanescens TaxID=181874 RepID=A0A409YTK4_9AGAR|nr:hypothetical protein CVT24_002508 [Panaeolus cyanescens]